MAPLTFGGLCVLALESRRAREIAKLIANLGGVPMVVPSVREVPLESNAQALDFAQKLAAGEVDMVVFTTGVGVKALASAVEGVCSRDKLSSHLSRVVVVARGPKPTAALRELGVRVSVSVPEPNTWRDLLAVLDQSKATYPVAGRRIAIQEYGVTNPDLSAGLEERGAIVTPVNVYQWALPEDLGPLEKAVQSIISGEVHVLLVASSVQIRHLFEVAGRMGKSEALQEALSRVVITSIGPLTSEELHNRDLSVDIECTHPKMGFLVQEAAEKSPEILRQKRGQLPRRTEERL
ncbi:MAG TPA: uroporphyrinogen-III synthase [Candidatus Dormibacteraeota bacterium]|nr:uroporphyrinogen-III synthase [Candidatus Dormibacteraeota bacterium]